MTADGKALDNCSDVPWLWWHTGHMPAQERSCSMCLPESEAAHCPGVMKVAQPWEDRKQPVTSRHGSPPGMLKAAGVSVWESTALEGYTVKLIDSAWVKLWL